MLRVCVRGFGVFVAAVVLAACSGRSVLPPIGEPLAVPASVQSAAATGGGAAAPAGYIINPLDVIRIDVFGEPELSFATLPVDTDGKIVMPMVGVVQAKGLTAGQLAADLATRLKRMLRNPQVSVNVLEFTSQKVTIGGAVNRPGQYQSAGELSLMQAVAVGGGLSEYGKADEVIVFRQQGAQRYAARFDVGAIQAGQMADPQLQSGDTVVVGVSNARRRFRDILAVLPFAAGVFVALASQLL